MGRTGRDRKSEDSGHLTKPEDKARYKTKICKHWEKNGLCRFGERCIFAHGGHELREAPECEEVKENASSCEEGGEESSPSSSLSPNILGLEDYDAVADSEEEKKIERVNSGGGTLLPGYPMHGGGRVENYSRHPLAENESSIQYKSSVSSAARRRTSIENQSGDRRNLRRFHRLFFSHSNSLW